MRGWHASVLSVALLLPLGGCSDGSTSAPEDGAGTAGGAPTSGAGGAGNVSAAMGGRTAEGTATVDGVTTYGPSYEGGEFHLGPVDFAESQWHNACAPGGGYAQRIRELEGDLLAGLWGGIPNVAGYCDACIYVTTDEGKSALLRVVTYGDTTENSIDVSPEAYAILDTGQYPRAMTWQFARCPDTGPVVYEFQSGSSEWWTSLWVRNARVPLGRVEARSPNHPSWTELRRGTDGTLTDDGGFGNGPFSIRLTGVDGSEQVDDFQWPSGGIAGATLEGQGNFD